MANLITLSEYKTYQGITSDKEDTKLNELIASVSQLVKTYCGNSFVDFYSTDKVEYFSLDWDTHIVQFTESPVNSIASVETRTNPESSYETLASSTYYLDTNTDSLLRLQGSSYKNWPRGPGAVKVTYRAGYSDTPEDLKLAVVDIITYYHKDEYKKRQTLSGATRENASSGDNIGFPDHIKRVLDLYKNY